MITNFEEITRELEPEEKRLILVLVNGFKTKSKENPMKAPVIIKTINSKKAELGIKKNFSEPRFRKLCNFIRSKGILPLIATSSGYYVSYDKNEIKKQIDSLNERAAAITNSANGLKKFL
jgi:IS4 transposase